VSRVERSFCMKIVRVGLAFRKFRRKPGSRVWVLEKYRTGMMAGPRGRLP